MSYVGQPFAHDIFISYTHADAAGDGNSHHKRWSQSFARELEAELRSLPRLGTAVRMFLDEDHRPERGVDPMAPLSDQLQSEIGASAIVAVLVSPQYLMSKWCEREREWWYQKQLELQIPFDQRIAVAHIWPLSPPEDVWPPLFLDSRGEPLVGFCFYDKKDAEIRPQPYLWPEVPEGAQGPFRDQLLQMVGSLRLKLNALKSTLEARERTRAEAAKLSGAGQLIYLHGRADRADAWRKACDALQASGFGVLPGEPDPVESDADKQEKLKQIRLKILAGCDALLLLASDNGLEVDADLVVVGRQDRHSARAVNQKLLPCALLDTVGAPIATAQRKNNARVLQVDWIDGMSDGWPAGVQRWLGQKGASLGGQT
jgi:hypothetical protein